MMRTYQTRQEFDEALRRIANTFECRHADWDNEESALYSMIMTNLAVIKRKSGAIQFGKKKIADLKVDQDGNVFYYEGWKRSKRRAGR